MKGRLLCLQTTSCSSLARKSPPATARLPLAGATPIPTLQKGTRPRISHLHWNRCLPLRATGLLYLPGRHSLASPSRGHLPTPLLQDGPRPPSTETVACHHMLPVWCSPCLPSHGGHVDAITDNRRLLPEAYRFGYGHLPHTHIHAPNPPHRGGRQKHIQNRTLASPPPTTREAANAYTYTHMRPLSHPRGKP